MGCRGPEFYDDDTVFATYAAKRARPGNPNDTLEKPVFDELAGDLANLRILDLGCGDARFGQEALQRGCRSYVGLEGSKKMYGLARANLAGTTGSVICTTIEEWTYPQQAFDLVTARLVLHYIQDVTSVFADVYQALVAGGRFIFSIEHPVITSCDRARKPDSVRQHWIVDDYFEVGPRVTLWMGGRVIKYHRTLEDHFGTLQQTGFIVNSLRESRPQREKFADKDTYLRRKRIPLMLFFSAVRPMMGQRRE
jgi:SAM-dependent methyltransferase